MQWSASEENAGFSTVSPWEPLDASYSTANVATETEDPDSLLNLYRSLINIRLRNPALVDGSYLPLTANPASVYSAIRQSEDQTILLIANLSDQPAAEVKFSSASMPLQGEYQLIPLFGSALQDSITIAPAGSGGSFTLTAEIPAESSSLFILESVH
jgi:glycosidase